MIALNETNEYAAEVPFTVPLATDPLTGLTGWAFTLGEVQIRLPGAGSWINVAVNKIREVGYGRFAARLTSGQCTTAGTVSIYAEVADTQPYRGTETISTTTGGDLAQLGTGYLMAYLPQAVDPVYGAPASGAFSALPGALARVAWQNAAYVTISNASVVEFGNGLYGIPVTAGDTVLNGKIYYYLTATDYQRYEDYSMVLGLWGVQIKTIGPTPVESTPIVGVGTVAPAITSHIAGAVDRLCEYAKAKSA